MALKRGLLIADVVHTRYAPQHHHLNYKVYYLAASLAELKQQCFRLFSWERFNLFSFYPKDHGFGTHHADAWVEEVLDKWGVTQANGSRVCVTMPRVLGYVFNPVSFWFCLDAQGQLRAVLSEVNNTYGERHGYLSAHPDQRPITQDEWMESEKVFHVSPFLDVQGKYAFRFSYGEEKIGVWIDYYIDNEKILSTSMIGRRILLDDRAFLRCFFRYPLVTLKVIGLIHYHALRLVMKGIRFRKKPPPPAQEITR